MSQAKWHEHRSPAQGTTLGPWACRDEAEAGREARLWMISCALPSRQWGSIKTFEQGRKPGKTFTLTLAIRWKRDGLWRETDYRERGPVRMVQQEKMGCSLSTLSILLL